MRSHSPGGQSQRSPQLHSAARGSGCSLHVREGRGGGTTGHAPPLATGVPSTGPTYLHSDHRLEACCGSSGTLEETRGWVTMGAGVCPPVLCPSGSQEVLLLGGSSSRNRFLGAPLESLPQDGQASKDIRTQISSHRPPQLPTGLVLMPRRSLQQLTLPTHVHTRTGFQPPPLAGAQSPGLPDPLPGFSSWLWM